MKTFILAIALIATTCSLTMASDLVYQKYDCPYFTVEYPTYWTIQESTGSDQPSYFVTENGVQNGLPVASIKIGFKSVSLQISENYRYLNQTGYLDESLLHFFNTFKIKKNALPYNWSGNATGTRPDQMSSIKRDFLNTISSPTPTNFVPGINMGPTSPVHTIS